MIVEMSTRRSSAAPRSFTAAALCWVVAAALLSGLASGCATGPKLRKNGVGRAAGPKAIVALAHDAARRHGVDPDLVVGVIAVESSFRTTARSHVGARGLMQLMPRTAASLARRLKWSDPDPEDPRFNIEAGTYYLAYLLRIFDNDEALALAAYNTGPARVKRWQRRGRALPRYSRRYVAAVRRAKQRYAGVAPAAARPEKDRAGLRKLLRDKLYGDRPDESLDRGEGSAQEG
jgi:soluble lytic murein transglycosylase-like protein